MAIFDRTGFILYVIRYQECVDFYQNKLGLPIMFTSDMLTCFQFGDAYLMVEFDDETTRTSPEPMDRYRSCLRMNVPNVKEYADRLARHQVEVDYQEHSWGTVAKFTDPEGNLCAFKDSDKFDQQIRDHLSS
ncbi:MAG: VOC family protein [Bacteroidota bacterium]